MAVMNAKKSEVHDNAPEWMILPPGFTFFRQTAEGQTHSDGTMEMDLLVLLSPKIVLTQQ